MWLARAQADPARIGELFTQTARYWTDTFAREGGSQEEKIATVVAMGLEC